MSKSSIILKTECKLDSIIAFLNSSNFSGSSDIDCANLNIDDKSSSMTARLRSFSSLILSYNNSNLSNNSCVSR